MSRRNDVQSADGVIASASPLGKTLVSQYAAPSNSQSGFAKGCIWLDMLNGAVYYNSGTTTSSTWTSLSGQSIAAAVAGVAAGYKVARGVTALDGSNPTPVTTGLTTVVAATVSLEGTAAPGLGTCCLTIASTNYATGALAVYAWKPTGAGDCTLIASTGTENFEWVAIGT